MFSCISWYCQMILLFYLSSNTIIFVPKHSQELVVDWTQLLILKHYLFYTDLAACTHFFAFDWECGTLCFEVLNIQIMKLLV